MKLTPFIFVFLFLFSTVVLAEETNEDLTLYNFEVEKLLSFGSGLLALFLSVLTWFAYRRSGNNRLSYVSLAFFLFAVKGFLIAHELFVSEWSFIDPAANILDFVILLAFFVGIVKK